jgi:hypothetical protein
MALTDAIITTGTNQPWLADQYTCRFYPPTENENEQVLITAGISHVKIA